MTTPNVPRVTTWNGTRVYVNVTRDNDARTTIVADDARHGQRLAAELRGALADAFNAGRAEGFNEGQRFPNLAPHELSARLSTCQHCNRLIVKIAGGAWIDPEATGDDEVWRETCDQHDTFTAEHEPVEEEPDNYPCRKCGRTDLPLHVNYQCPECYTPAEETS